MSVKARKKSKYDDSNFDDEMPVKKKKKERRRPIKNWKKQWNLHEKDYEDVEDFYSE